MKKVSKKQRKQLRSIWRLGRPHKRREHSRRISNALEKGLRR